MTRSQNDDDLLSFGRYVAIEDDLEKVRQGAFEAIRLLKSETPLELFTVPGLDDRPADAIRWMESHDPNLLVTLTLDRTNRIAYVDAQAADPEAAAAILEAFDATATYGTLDEHLALLDSDNGERQLVRVALAAGGHDYDQRVADVFQQAFASPLVENRRAATYAVRVLGWPVLAEALAEAEPVEPDEELRHLMRAVLHHSAS
ncbi:hypothetical protein O4J55_10685 [Paracoccus sp. PXZ]